MVRGADRMPWPNLMAAEHRALGLGQRAAKEGMSLVRAIMQETERLFASAERAGVTHFTVQRTANSVQPLSGLVQSHECFRVAHSRRPDETGGSDAHRMQIALNFPLPEIEELMQYGVARCDIQILPYIGLE